MKKNRFFWASAAIAALTLTACADQDEFNQNDVQTAAVENAPGAIQFGTYLGQTGTTRAAVAQDYDKGTITNEGTNPLNKAQFGVFGYYTKTTDWVNGQTTVTPNFMYNQRIQWDDTGYWFYTPVKYWPNGIDLANTENNASPSNTARETEVHKVSFFAYAPYTANALTGSTIETPYATSFDYGDDPINATGVLTDYFKTTAYTGTWPNGVIGMISWVGTAATVSNDPWINYGLAPASNKAQADDVVDLLWGLRGQYTYDETDNADNTINKLGTAYNTDLTKQSVDEKVRFLFKHALAKVGGNTSTKTADKTVSGKQQCGLKVVLDVDANSSNPGTGSDNQTPYQGGKFNEAINGGNTNSTLVTIKKVTIQDGTSASDDYSNAVTDTKSDLINYGWFNLATGQWKNQIVKKNEYDASPLIYDISAESTAGTAAKPHLNDDIAEPGTVSKSLLATGGAAWDYTKCPHGVTTEVKNVYADVYNDGTADVANDVPALVVIPTDATIEQTIYVTVDYMVRTADTQLSKGYSEVEQIISNEVKLKGLEANKYYTLIMHLGLTSVKFEAVVADWAFNDDAIYDETGEATEEGENIEKSVWLPSNVVNSTSIDVDAGTTHKHVTVADVTETYTVNLTGLDGTSGNVYDFTLVSCKNPDGTDVTNAPGTGGYNATGTGVSGKVATIKLHANQTANDIINVIKITEKNSSSKVLSETTVTITQQKAEIILTPSVTSIPWNSGTFTIAATHANGTNYTSAELSATNVVTVSPAGAATFTYADGVITVTPSKNTATTNRTIAITVTPYSGVTATTNVTQAASTSPKLTVTAATTPIPKEGGASNKVTLTIEMSNGTPVAANDTHVSITSPAIGTGTEPQIWLTKNTDGTLQAAENKSGFDRSTTVTVTYEPTLGEIYTGTVIIIQKGE